MRQCLKVELLDEINIPLLWGSGIRLFERMGLELAALKIASVVASPGVTRLQYRVIKSLYKEYELWNGSSKW